MLICQRKKKQQTPGSPYKKIWKMTLCSPNCVFFHSIHLCAISFLLTLMATPDKSCGNCLLYIQQSSSSCISFNYANHAITLTSFEKHHVYYIFTGWDSPPHPAFYNRCFRNKFHLVSTQFCVLDYMICIIVLIDQLTHFKPDTWFKPHLSKPSLVAIGQFNITNQLQLLRVGLTFDSLPSFCMLMKYILS